MRLLAAATFGTSLLGCFALVQTLAGRSRFDLTPVTGPLLAVGVISLVVPALVVAVAVAVAAGTSRHRDEHPCR
jgi:hypothetical protein